MDAALKSAVVPKLRELGFKGSYPHFYRDRNGHVDLLSFQFSSWGGRLVSEIAFAVPDRSNLIALSRHTAPARLRVTDTGRRLRLSSDGRSDPWFIYDAAMPGELCQSPTAIADRLVALVVTEGEPWWSDKRAGPADFNLQPVRS